jgi:hypothetical protein
MYARVVALVCLAGLTGCSVFGGAKPSTAPTRLQVQVTQITAVGSVATIRGAVTNPTAERVAGIRYVVTVRDKGDPSQVLDRIEQQAETVLEPGATAPVNLSIENRRFAAKEFRIAIEATPATLGGRTVSPPSN